MNDEQNNDHFVYHCPPKNLVEKYFADTQDKVLSYNVSSVVC